jgi:hypothetical protein
MNGKRLDVFGTGKAERYPHGTHARYALGPCRCFPCKLANADYETRRYTKDERIWHCRIINARGRSKGQYYVINRDTKEIVLRTFDRNEARAEALRLNKRDVKPRPPRASQLVSVAKIRKHARCLQTHGVGLKRLAKEARVAYSSLERMLGQGQHDRPIKRTRRSALERILAVKPTAIANGAHVEAGPTVELLARLIKRYPKCKIAKWLDASSKTGRPQLQIGKRGFVTVRNAKKVFALYLRLQQNDWRLPKIAPVFVIAKAEPSHRRARREAIAA